MDQPIPQAPSQWVSITDRNFSRLTLPIHHSRPPGSLPVLILTHHCVQLDMTLSLHLISGLTISSFNSFPADFLLSVSSHLPSNSTMLSYSHLLVNPCMAVFLSPVSSCSAFKARVSRAGLGFHLPHSASWDCSQPPLLSCPSPDSVLLLLPGFLSPAWPLPLHDLGTSLP